MCGFAKTEMLNSNANCRKDILLHILSPQEVVDSPISDTFKIQLDTPSTFKGAGTSSPGHALPRMVGLHNP